MSKIIRLPKESPLLRRMNPEIQTSAKPAAEWLVQARAELNSVPEIRNALARGSEQHDPEGAVRALTVELAKLWGVEAEEAARECAQYLWDEYAQLGEGIYIVSAETGRVVATLTEADLWQSPMVPREGGGWAKPLVRLRPDLEGLIVSTLSDVKREARILDTLASRANQTDLLIQEGDPRLLPATVAGRKQLMAAMASLDPLVLLQAAGGTSGAFLRHFDLTREAPVDSGLEKINGEVLTRSVTGVQDQTTMNLRHDRAGTIRGAAVQGWVREIARRLSLEAVRKVGVEQVALSDLTKVRLEESEMWVASPSSMKVMSRVSSVPVLPVEGAEAIGLSGKVGVIVVPEGFETASLERFDMWEALTGLEYEVWIDWSSVSVLQISGVPHQAVVF